MRSSRAGEERRQGADRGRYKWESGSCIADGSVPQKESRHEHGPGAEQAIHRGAKDLPFVSFLEGMELTGPVFAVTFSGAWKYLEYPEVNTAGSHLFEPAHSVHTLTVPKDVRGITDIWFAIYGANLDLDAQGNVESVIDVDFVHQFHLAECENRGLPKPDVILGTR